MTERLIPLRFDAWATRQMLEACRVLTADELGRTFDIGCGSVRQSFLHISSAQMYWTDRLLARGERDLPEDGPRDESVDALLTLHATVSAELYAAAQRLFDEGKLDAPVRLLYAEYQGRSIRAATVLAHVVNHGSHHRGQARYMLRQMGHPLAVDLDPVEWELAGER